MRCYETQLLDTLRYSNMAMENGSFIGNFPIEMSMNEGFSYGFSIAMFDDRRVVNVIEPHWTPKWLVASRLRMAFNFPGEQVGHFPQAIDPIEAWNMGIISASFFLSKKSKKTKKDKQINIEGNQNQSDWNLLSWFVKRNNPHAGKQSEHKGFQCFLSLPIAKHDYKCCTADSDEHQVHITSACRKGSCFEVSTLNPTHHHLLRLQQCHPVAWPLGQRHATNSLDCVCALGKHNVFHASLFIYNIYIHQKQQIYRLFFSAKKNQPATRAKLSKQEQTWAHTCKIEQTQRQIHERNQKEQKWAWQICPKGKSEPRSAKKEGNMSQKESPRANTSRTMNQN